MDNYQKCAIITGAYGAIGKAIAEGTAANGYRVTLVGRDKTRLEEVRATIIKFQIII